MRMFYAFILFGSLVYGNMVHSQKVTRPKLMSEKHVFNLRKKDKS